MAFFVLTVREAILLEEPAGAALAFSISLGNLIVLDASIALLALCFAGTIAYARFGVGDKS